MLSSLMLRDPPLFFSQLAGSCYHYSPTTAALLYEVTMIRPGGGTDRQAGKMAKDNIRMAAEFGAPISFAAICHKTPNAVNAAVYGLKEDGTYEWWLTSEPPYERMSGTAAIRHVRYLNDPMAAFRTECPPGSRMKDVSFQSFLSFLHRWIEQQPYYFPARRQAELAARVMLKAIDRTDPSCSLQSLPGLGAYVFINEFGNVRLPSPDLFDENGNAKPSETRINPMSYFRRKQEPMVSHTAVPRAALVYELFANGKEWDGHRVDGNPSNDRIENLVHHGYRPEHAIPFTQSMLTKDAVLRYHQVLPKELHFCRGWRYGIDRLAFDIDATL